MSDWCFSPSYSLRFTGVKPNTFNFFTLKQNVNVFNHKDKIRKSNSTSKDFSTAIFSCVACRF